MGRVNDNGNTQKEIYTTNPLNENINKYEIEQDLKFAKEKGTIITDKGPRFGKRHIEVIFFFAVFFINQSMRQHINLTIVAMTDPKANPNKDIVTFDWKNKNVIISAFFWGYIWPQVCAGWLMARYGHKWFLIGSTATVSVLTLMVPWLAVHLGSTAVVVSRVVQGFSQGLLVPSIFCFMSRWVPVSERSRSGAFIFAGAPFSSVVCMSLAGAIAASPYGWPMTFYVFSICGLSWCVMYSFFGYNAPAKHPKITDAEKIFIENSAVDASVKSPKTPWKHIFTSLPMFALVYAQSASILVNWVLLSQIPTYMNKIMNFDIRSNGVLTASLYLLQWLLGIVISALADIAINRKYLSITATRKITTAIGCVGPAFGMICLIQCNRNNHVVGVILLAIAVSLWGANFSGIHLNNLDIAPNFAGIMQGLVNAISHIFAAAAPLMVQSLVHDENNLYQWKQVFYITSAISVSAAVIFGLLGSGEKQHWNEIVDEIADSPEAIKLTTDGNKKYQS